MKEHFQDIRHQMAKHIKLQRSQNNEVSSRAALDRCLGKSHRHTVGKFQGKIEKIQVSNIGE